jgi:hypothetical protein
MCDIGLRQACPGPAPIASGGGPGLDARVSRHPRSGKSVTTIEAWSSRTGARIQANGRQKRNCADQAGRQCDWRRTEDGNYLITEICSNVFTGVLSL